MKPEVFPHSAEPDRTLGAPEPGRFAITAALSLAYLLLALACLIQWGTARPWTRVDLFSGVYLGLRLLGALYSLASSRRAFRSRPLRREWWGETSVAATERWVILLMFGDLMVFLDYGHWHIVSSLERPTLQGIGLVLYLFGAVWQIWTDSYLARHFNDDRFLEAPTVVGPFRHVRHPRYAAAIVGKIAFSLVFASAFGWLFLLPWTVLLLHKVRAEEVHLRRLFGPRYQQYAERTARLVPGVY